MLKLTFKQVVEGAVEFQTLNLADLDQEQIEAIEAAAHGHIISGEACPTESTFTIEVDGEEHEGYFLGEYYLGWDEQADSLEDDDEKPTLDKIGNSHWSNPLKRRHRWFLAEEIEGDRRFLIQARDSQEANRILDNHTCRATSDAWIIRAPEILPG